VTVLGTQPDPAALRRATGRIREADEALLVIVRGIVRDGPRKTSGGGGGLTLTLNDGTGAVRVAIAAGTGITSRSLPTGAWVELKGVVGQQTTGSAPNAGYRLWPRDRADVRLLARVASGGSTASGATKPTTSGRQPAAVHRTAASPPMTIRPRLGGTAILAPAGSAAETAAEAAPAPLPGELSFPLAGSIAGLVGLATLAWRHGTWGRCQVEVMDRTAEWRSRLRTGAHDDGEESYTLAP
jgi:hypothetical protein